MLIISTSAVAEIIQAVSAALVAGAGASASAADAPSGIAAAAALHAALHRRNVIVIDFPHVATLPGAEELPCPP
jgi:hypothetical protein